jgi:hypothetical protein
VIPNECIIIGGGKSILEGLNRGLQPLLASKFTILTNYAYKTFPGTFLAFQDKEFYIPDHAKHYSDPKTIRHPDIYEELKTLPLIIGINNNGIEEFKLDNTILLDKKYRTNLTGMFALRLVEMIMKEGTIYLLGFDWPRRTGLPERDPNYNPKSDLQIHYYDDIKHRGSGYVGYYENHNPDKDFAEFTKKDTFKIYNVSLESNIDCFEKISYVQFFRLLTNKSIDQDTTRSYIRRKFNE